MLSVIDLLKINMQIFIDQLNNAIDNNDPQGVMENLRNIGVKVTYNVFFIPNPDLGKKDVLKDAIRTVIDNGILANNKHSNFRSASFLKDFKEFLNTTKDGLRTLILSSKEEEEFFAIVNDELNTITPEYINTNKRPRPL